MKIQFFVLMIAFGILGVLPNAGGPGIAHGDHVLHFAGWAAGGVSLRLAFPRAAAIRAGIGLWIYSLGIEIAQIPVPARSFEIADLVSNAAGIITGLFAMKVMRDLRRRRI